MWTLFKYVGIPILVAALGLGAKVGWDHYQQEQYTAVERDKSFERRNTQAEILQKDVEKERVTVKEEQGRREEAIKEAEKVGDIDKKGDPAMTTFLNRLLP